LITTLVSHELTGCRDEGVFLTDDRGYKGIWRQGDFMVINPQTKGIMIQGRSDGVLNPSGVRFGSGEIYTILEQFSSVLDDSLCVGQRRPRDTDERVLLFVKMHQGKIFSKELERTIRAAIRKGLSARHVPTYIFEVTDIPVRVLLSLCVLISN
jgi:acetoacetyl-CoA synthetase